MITFVVEDRNGSQIPVEVPEGINLNLMEVLKASEYDILATCGGMALCASCHVYVLSEHPLPEPSDDELAMLDSAFFVTANSRLGCQLRIREELDGLRLQLAPVGE